MITITITRGPTPKRSSLPCEASTIQKTLSRPSHSMWPLPVIHITSDMAILFVPVSHWRRLRRSYLVTYRPHNLSIGALSAICNSVFNFPSKTVHSTHQSQESATGTILISRRPCTSSNYTSTANHAHSRLLLFHRSRCCKSPFLARSTDGVGSSNDGWTEIRRLIFDAPLFPDWDPAPIVNGQGSVNGPWSADRTRFFARSTYWKDS